MFDHTLARINRWAVKNVGREWLDYVAGNTMTEVNRRWNSFVWTYEPKAIIVGIRNETPDVKTITLMPNQRWKGMVPGQHITVTAELAGEKISRSYSLSPMENECFTITVKRVPGGRMSGWIHQAWKPGMVVDIGLPQGDFCYRQQSKILFICAGSGITPCYSMAKSLLAQSMRPDMAMYAQFSSSRDIIFRDTLRQWRSEGLALTKSLSRPTADDAATGAFAPMLDADNIESLLPDFREREIYLCGPQGFMDEIVAILKDKGYDFDRLHSERFTAHRAAHDGDACRDGAPFKTANAMVHFQHLNRCISLTEADEGQSLMQIAERHKVPIETGCRQGMCGTCKLTLREGTVSGNTLGKAVYLCTAFPASKKLVLDA